MAIAGVGSLKAAARMRGVVPALARRIAAGVALTMVAIALLGSFFTPHLPSDSIGVPFSLPSSFAPLGTDFLGHDVLSRLLAGGRSLILLASLSILVAYIVGAAAGLLAGYRRGRTDAVIMRTVDIILSMPAFVVIPILVIALGQGVVPMVIGIALVTAPEIARVVRAATFEAVGHDYVAAAVADGESTSSVLVREIVPNLAPTFIADFGYRFTGAAYLVAALNFLGLGLGPSSVDWAVMISENRTGILFQPLAVIAPAVALMILAVSMNLAFDVGRSRERAPRHE